MSVEPVRRCDDCGTAIGEIQADSRTGDLVCRSCWHKRPGGVYIRDDELSSYLQALGTTGKTTTPKTAAQSQNGVSYLPGAGKTPNDRYANRHVDLDALLALPAQPIPWRVHNVVADGTLTIISGESGAGKSWLAQAFCTGVAKGSTVAGLKCERGPALYVDAEMGPRMFVDQRLRPTGAVAAEFSYIDAMGLDISTADDLAWLRRGIEKIGAKVVVIDSLRRLTPSKSENDSDDMAPTVAALAKLARDTWAAIVLLHHKGDSEKFFRGSTAIKDQADALFALLRDGDDEHAPMRLRCRGGRGKMRYAVEPPDVYLRIAPEHGGVVGADPPEDDAEPVVPVREAVAHAIKASMPAKTKAEVADKAGRKRNDVTFGEVWKALASAEQIVQVNGVWQLSASLQRLGETVEGQGSAEGWIE